MAREPDEVIPADEPLYRSISIEDVNGDDVLPQAVDLPRCSFNRSAYSKPEAVFAESRPSDNGIAELLAGGLPPPVPRETGVPYEFIVVDDPNPPEDLGNDAHCEVCMKRRGELFNKKHEPNKGVLAKAKDALARKLRVHTYPK